VGSLVGYTGDHGGGRLDGDVGGLDTLSNNSLSGVSGGATLLAVQRGGRLGMDAGSLWGSSSGCLVIDQLLIWPIIKGSRRYPF
jgi:hypothetical protein